MLSRTATLVMYGVKATIMDAFSCRLRRREPGFGLAWWTAAGD